MRFRDFSFTPREFGGAFGGWGILLPLFVGYVAVCGMNPSGLFLTFGLANLFFGLYYRLPLPLEPMKVLAVVAIAHSWSPSMIHAAALAMGLVWLLFAATGIMAWLRRITPESVVRGVCLALGMVLFIQAVRMFADNWLQGSLAAAVLILSALSRNVPGTVLILLLGLLLAYWQTEAVSLAFTLNAPSLTLFTPAEALASLAGGGIAQIPLTLANAVILTAALVRNYWPERSDISEDKLAWNHGVMNTAASFFGGVPMCHGAGSLAGRYYFGARTGAASVIEGLVQLIIGVFLAGFFLALLVNFPLAILGAMLMFVAVELAKTARGSWRAEETIPLLATAIPAVAVNMAVGFACGLFVHSIIRYRALLFRR